MLEPILLVHGYSSQSRTTRDEDIRKIYGHLPDLLRQQIGAEIAQLDLSRYISLEDGLTIDDISRAMNRALRQDFSDLLQTGFNAIVHSTGALVVRNWMRKYWEDVNERCPARRVVHLAGANFGSGWAHIGRSQLAKWGRMLFQGAERGVRVLDALELGSNWTIDMHTQLDTKIQLAPEANRPLEFCMIGSQRPDEFSLIPVKYATEPGSDGVVRVSASNLNYAYVRLVHRPDVEDLTPAAVRKDMKRGFGVSPKEIQNPNLPANYYRVGQHSPPRNVPMTVVYDCSHSYKSSSIVDGERPRDQVLSLISTALRTNHDSYEAASESFQRSDSDTRERVKEMRDGRYALVVRIDRQPQYNRFAQLIFRIFDQDGNPIKHFNLFFNSFGGGDRPRDLINARFHDTHANRVSTNTITFYLCVHEWDDAAGDWINKLDEIGGCVLEIDAVEHGNPEIAYVPLRFELNAHDLATWIRPDQTTVIDVYLYRVPGRDVFKIVAG